MGGEAKRLAERARLSDILPYPNMLHHSDRKRTTFGGPNVALSPRT